MSGRLIVRTTTRWLAMPRRTRLERPFSEKVARSVAATASESTTSPSSKAPDGRGAIAVAVSSELPLTRTSAAATLPASISRPTVAFSLFFLVSWSMGIGLTAIAGRTQSLNRQEREKPLPWAQKCPQGRPGRSASSSADRLAADDPVGGFRIDEARGLQVMEAVVVEVVMYGAGCWGLVRSGADRAVALLGKGAFDVEGAQGLAFCGSRRVLPVC